MKKFLLGWILALAGFASVYAIIQPNINGLTTTTSISTDYKLMVQDGTTQRAITAGNFANSISGSFITTETDPVWNSVSWDYIPFSWSDTKVYWTIKFQEWAWLLSTPWTIDFGIARMQAQNPWLWTPYFEINNNPWIWDATSAIRIQDNLFKMYYISWWVLWVQHRLELWEWALEYQWDYSDNFVDWSLVDKRYVDGELSWIETFWEFDWVTLNPTATWDVSLKIGLGSQANTSNSASIGQYAWANWTGSYAFGNSAWALWEGSFAIGWQANADGRNAYSVWYNSEANQEDSYVFGVQSVANWFGSMTLWQYATSNNTFSTAIWYSSQANADYSISAGNNTITNSVSSMAIWKYNVWNADSVFEVGFGTNTDRANLFEVKNNWNIYVSKLTGYTCLATDSAGMVYDNTGVFANYVPYTAVDTGFNNTGSDTIIPSEKAVWSLVGWLTNNYIPYRSWDRMYNSNFINTLHWIQHTWNILTWIALKIQTGNIVLWWLYTTIYWWTRNVLFWNWHILSWNDNLLIWDDSSTQSSRWFVWWEGSKIWIWAHNSFVFWDRNTSNWYNSFSIWVLSTVFNNYSFMRSDDFSTPHQTVRDNTFIVYTKGWFWINTNNPLTWWLSVSWSIQIPGDNYFYIWSNWRITTSGWNLSFQAFTGWVWAEKGSYTP